MSAEPSWRVCYYCGQPTMFKLTTATRVYGVCEEHRDLPRRDPGFRVAVLPRDRGGRK